MVKITDEQFKVLKENYNFAQEIKELQEPLTKYEIKELRALITKHIGEGYTNYLRVVTVYSTNRDANLGIFVRILYNNLLSKY